MTTGGYRRLAQVQQVPPRLVQKIRTVSMAAGIGTVLLSVALGGVAITMGGSLPISDHPMASLSTIMVSLMAFFTLWSGVALMGGRTYVKADQLDVFVAVRARRLLLVVWISSTVLGMLACLNLLFVAGAPDYVGKPVLPALMAYMLFPVALVLLSGADVFIGRRLFRPSDKLLRQYTARPW